MSNDLNLEAGLESASDMVKRIARRAQLSNDIAEDYLATTKIESGHKLNVRDSSKGAQGFGQVIPDVKGGTTRTIGGRKYNLRNPDENIEAGLRYFAAGGDDPVARRLHYFGGPKAKQYYNRTGRIPNISDGNMTAVQYVKATGGLRKRVNNVDVSAGLEDDPLNLDAGLEDRSSFTPQTGVVIPSQSTKVTPPPSTRSGLFQKPSAPLSRPASTRSGLFNIPAPPVSLADLKRADEPVVNQIATGQKVRRAIEATAPPGFSLLPKDMREWIGGAIAKSAGGLTETFAGAWRDLPMWIPSMGIAGVNTKEQTDAANRVAQELQQGAMVMDEESRRGFISQTTQDVLAGSITTAPALALTALGVPAPIAFGLQGYLSARGRDAEPPELLLETGKGATIGALFELPVPKKLDILARTGSKLGIAGKAGTKAGVVGSGTFAVDVATGAPTEEAGTNAAVNALFAGSGIVKAGKRRGRVETKSQLSEFSVPEVPRALRMPESIPDVPVSTIAEPKLIKGGLDAQRKVQSEGRPTSEARSRVGEEVAPVDAITEGEINRIRYGQQAKETQVVPQIPTELPAVVKPVESLQSQEGGTVTPSPARETLEVATPTTPTTIQREGRIYTRNERGEWIRPDGKRVHGVVERELNEMAGTQPAADPDAILQQAQSLPSKATKSPISEAGFVDVGELARGSAAIIREFPDQIRDLTGAFKQRTAEARETARNVARETFRAVAVSQVNPEFKKVWTGIVTAQEEAAGRLFDMRQHLHDAWKPLRLQEREAVAKVVYEGNEIGRVFSPQQLSEMGLNERQITAYQRVRRAQDTALDTRRDQIVERLDDAMGRLADPDQIATLERLKRDVSDHYMQLKSEGYVSLQRIGDYAVVAKDADGRVHYDHEETARGAQRRTREFRREGMTVLRIEKMENRLPSESRRMSPEEFETAVQSSNVNPDAPEVQRIRDEIYSRYPSKGYELKRDFTPGYKQTKAALTASILRQGEVYTNTYKNSLGRLRAERALLDSGVDAGLQRYGQRFIEHEVNAAPLTVIGKGAQRGRQLVYLKTLAADVGQFYMNAVAQPIQMNWSYFARPELGLRGAQPEIYFARGWKLSGQALVGRAPRQFQQLFDRAVKEGIGQAQLTRSLAEAEIHGRSRVMEVLSLPMQLGERVTRGHALAEAYLVGKEKLNLKGDALYRFMADSTYATQTRTGAGEAPGAIRMTGEVGRSIYQFQAFQQMYLENLGLSIRSDLKRGVLPVSTARFVAGTVISAGLRGLPMAGAATVVSKAVFGEDWQSVFERLMKDKPLLRDLALYGVLGAGEPGVSERLNAPFSQVPQVPQMKSEADLIPRIPTASVAADILIRAPSDLYRGDYIRAAEDLAPRFIRGPLRAYRYEQEGIKTRGGSTIASRKALTLKDKLLTIFNTPTRKESEYYHRQRMQRADKAVQKVRRLMRKAVIPPVPTEKSLFAP